MCKRNMVWACVLGLGVGGLGHAQAQSGLHATLADWANPSDWPVLRSPAPISVAGLGSHGAWAALRVADATPSSTFSWRLELAWTGQRLGSGVPVQPAPTRLSYSMESAAGLAGSLHREMVWPRPRPWVSSARFDLGLALGLGRVRGAALGLQAGLGLRLGPLTPVWAGGDYTLGLSYALGSAGKATAIWQGARSGAPGEPLRSRFWLAWVASY